MLDCSPLIPPPHRAHVISTDPGRGHGGLWSDCSGIISWGGVAGTSGFLVAVGQSLPLATHTDLLWGAWWLWLWLQL